MLTVTVSQTQVDHAPATSLTLTIYSLAPGTDAQVNSAKSKPIVTLEVDIGKVQIGGVEKLIVSDQPDDKVPCFIYTLTTMVTIHHYIHHH